MYHVCVHHNPNRIIIEYNVLIYYYVFAMTHHIYDGDCLGMQCIVSQLYHLETGH